MDFWRTLLVIFRRWYVALPAFCATLGMAYATYSLAPDEYQSNAILVLTTPVAGSSEEVDSEAPEMLTNPLLSFDRSLSLSASILIQQLDNRATAISLGTPPGGATSYQVTNGSTNPELLESGPFVFVEGTGPTPEAAEDVTRAVSARAAAILAERQHELNAPASTYISLQVVVPPTRAELLTGSPRRAAAAVGALAGLLSLAAVYGFENAMTHRRRRRQAKDVDSTENAMAGLPR